MDFVTIHAGINRETAAVFKRNPRLMNFVSRGGSLLYAWMELNNQENPFFEYYDELLEICAKYDVTISLGDACRPGSLKDATDASQIKELMTLGELTLKAWDKNVQVMIEGPGHIPLNEVASKIAAHTADIAKGIPGAIEWDHEMSQTRRDLDWEKMFSLALLVTVLNNLLGLLLKSYWMDSLNN